MLLPSGSWAQESPATPRPDDLQRALDQMLLHPGDAAATRAYAVTALRHGEYRTAIAALERLLRDAPGDHAIRLDLAEAYAASASPLADVHAQLVLEAADAGDELKLRARRILRQPDAIAPRSRFSGSLAMGARWDSNANQQARAQQLANLNVGLANAGLRPRADWSLVTTGRLTHELAAVVGARSVWRTDLDLYDQRYKSLQRSFDIRYLAIETGPRLVLAEGGSRELAFRPSISAAQLAYGDRTSAWITSAEGQFDVRLGSATWVVVGGGASYGKYQPTALRATASDLTGVTKFGFVEFIQGVAQDTFIVARATVDRGRSQRDYLDYVGWEGSLRLLHTGRLAGRKLTVEPQVSLRHSGYDAPDPNVDPGRSRFDRRIDFGVDVTLEVLQSLDAYVSVAHRDNRSNVQDYAFRNTFIGSGLRLRF